MVEVRGLTKYYGDFRAIHDVSFTAEHGEILGLLGPNGAGKTTTMRIVTGFMPATEGTVSVEGFDVVREAREARRRIGYLPENPPLYHDMTVSSYLKFVGRIKGVAKSALDDALERVLTKCFLTDVATRIVSRLSKGYRQRVGLAGALIHNPPVLILDEPTDGLDPNQKHEVRTLVNEMSRDKIIVISTHILEEVEAVCTRAIIIARGRIVADDTPQGLATKSRYHNAVSLKLERPDQLAAARAAVAALPSVAEVEVSEREGSLTALPRAGQSILSALNDLAQRQGLKLKELHLESGRLDEVFRTITA
jgi:ABC-2 type transport system ATP-binding protein